MTARRTGGNPLTRGIARLVVDAGTGALDAILDIGTGVRSRYAKADPEPVPRRIDWWNTPEPRSKDASATARSSRRSRRAFPTSDSNDHGG